MGDSLGYFAADVVETLGVLSRRLLAHWLPQGHVFDMQPRNRALHCSGGYVQWCVFSLKFLLDGAPSSISGIRAPRGAGKRILPAGV